MDVANTLRELVKRGVMLGVWTFHAGMVLVQVHHLVRHQRHKAIRPPDESGRRADNVLTFYFFVGAARIVAATDAEFDVFRVWHIPAVKRRRLGEVRIRRAQNVSREWQGHYALVTIFQTAQLSSRR